METITSGWTRDEFYQKLKEKGYRYHIHHPFHIAMHEGKLSKQQIQGWVLNRFYYQINLPRKDAYILAKSHDLQVRRHWIQRIIDHDGQGDEGGINAWIRLGEACGLHRVDLLSLQYVLPAVRFAVDSYVNFCKEASWQEAVCASLTELFAPDIHRLRLASFPEYYPWIDPKGFEYFQKRLKEASRDVNEGLRITLDHFITHEQQERALNILQFKLDILWTILDALYLAYVAQLPSSNPETILRNEKTR